MARISQGAAAAATWTAGLALVAEHYVEKRVQMMGFAMMGNTAGSVVGPAAGGWLYEIGGYTLPFAITGVLVAIDAALRFLLLPFGSNCWTTIKNIITRKDPGTAAREVARRLKEIDRLSAARDALVEGEKGDACYDHVRGPWE